jgi:hypothetical protein
MINVISYKHFNNELHLVGNLALKSLTDSRKLMPNFYHLQQSYTYIHPVNKQSALKCTGLHQMCVDTMCVLSLDGTHFE